MQIHIRHLASFGLSALLAAGICIATPAISNAVSEAGAVSEKVSDCTMNLSWPHHSSHKPGTASSLATIECDSIPQYMGIQVVLRRETNPGAWLKVGYDEGRNSDGKAMKLHIAASEECHNAKYRAIAELLLVDNRGQRHERTHQTNDVSVTC